MQNRWWIRGVLLLFLAGRAWAKTPTLDLIEPAGGPRGTTVAVTLTGNFDHWPTKVWVDGAGVAFEPGSEKGKYTVKIAADATPGLRWCRVYDEEGASRPGRFDVGLIPEVLEVEPNDSVKSAQSLESTRILINGKLAKNGDVDGYSIDAKAGQTLVADLVANTGLGSPMDGVIQIVSPAGFVVAQNDDDQGRDPRVAFQVPEDGLYIVRLFAFPATPDSRIGFSGGSNFVYRLTVTTEGFAEYPWPLAITQGQPQRVAIQGWNLPQGVFREVSSAEADRILLTHPEVVNPFRLSYVAYPTVLEVEPNSRLNPQIVSAPISISGRIDTTRDEDVYRFQAIKATPLTIRVESRSLGRPLDPTLQILDDAGKILAETDDSEGKEDAFLKFSAPSDGSYRAVVRDLFAHGSVRHAYLLTIAPEQPDFKLSSKSDRFTVALGKAVDLPIKVDRLAKFEETVELSVEGLPESIKVETQTLDAKADISKPMNLKVQAGLEKWSGPIRVVGRSKGVKRVAQTSFDGLGALETFWLTVTAPEPEKGK